MNLIKTFDLCSKTALFHLFRERKSPQICENTLRKLYKTSEITESNGFYILPGNQPEDHNGIYPLLVFADLEAGREIAAISSLGKNAYKEPSYFRDDCIYTLHYLSDYESLFSLENRLNTGNSANKEMQEFDKHILVFDSPELFEMTPKINHPYIKALVKDINKPEIIYSER